jgi:hypothetical protein
MSSLCYWRPYVKAKKANEHQIDNELESCARELIAYLDNDAEVEKALPASVGFMVKQMRAAIFAKAMRTLAPAQRCRIYRHCRPSQ